MNSWIEFLIAKKWNILTIIITFIVGVLLYIYDKKKNSKVARIINLCQIIIINIINIIKCFKISFLSLCCCCCKKNPKDAKKIKIKKGANKLINTITDEVDVMKQLKSNEDEEWKGLLTIILDKNDERQNLCKREEKIEIEKKEEKIEIKIKEEN